MELPGDSSQADAAELLAAVPWFPHVFIAYSRFLSHSESSRCRPKLFSGASEKRLPKGTLGG